MRINQQWLKHRRHEQKITFPHVIKIKYAKEINDGNVPSPQQIKMAIELGIVKKTISNKIDVTSLDKYFQTFIRQRKADDQRN